MFEIVKIVDDFRVVNIMDLFSSVMCS